MGLYGERVGALSIVRLNLISAQFLVVCVCVCAGGWGFHDSILLGCAGLVVFTYKIYVHNFAFCYSSVHVAYY